MSQTVDLSEFEDRMAQLDDLFAGPGMVDVMTYVAGRVGVLGERIALPYYPPASGKPLDKYYERQHPDGSTYWSKFKNRKQQGLVMALAEAGKIPRTRTGKLGQAMTSEVREATPTSATVVVGNKMPYAPYVIDQQRQSHYHKGTWSVVQKNLRDGRDRLELEAASAMLAAIRKQLGG